MPPLYWHICCLNDQNLLSDLEISFLNLGKGEYFLTDNLLLKLINRKRSNNLRHLLNRYNYMNVGVRQPSSNLIRFDTLERAKAQKPLIEIEGIPLVIHTYRRAKLSKKLDDVFICCDDKRIFNIAKKYNAKAILTSSHHKNGTERICEAYLKNKKKFDLIIDIQGDEPLISPYHIDRLIEFHKKNKLIDIVLPHLLVKNLNNPNLVKIVSDKKNNVLYLSRA